MICGGPTVLLVEPYVLVKCDTFHDLKSTTWSALHLLSCPTPPYHRLRENDPSDKSHDVFFSVLVGLIIWSAGGYFCRSSFFCFVLFGFVSQVFSNMHLGSCQLIYFPVCRQALWANWRLRWKGCKRKSRPDWLVSSSLCVDNDFIGCG